MQRRTSSRVVNYNGVFVTCESSAISIICSEAGASTSSPCDSLLTSSSPYVNVSNHYSNCSTCPESQRCRLGDVIFRTSRNVSFQDSAHYEIQDVSLWLDDGKDAEEEEDPYESIYETIRSPSSESDFDEILEEEEEFDDDDNDEGVCAGGGGRGGNIEPRDSRRKGMDSRKSSAGLSKFAEAAGRKMKKLRRNWSLRKNDITRSLSRIKKTNFPSDLTVSRRYRKKSSLIETSSTPKISSTSSSVMTAVLSTDSSSSSSSSSTSSSSSNKIINDSSSESGGNVGDAMFYITLTIQEKEEQEKNIKNKNGSRRTGNNGRKKSVRSTSRKASVVKLTRPTEAPPAPPVPTAPLPPPPTPSSAPPPLDKDDIQEFYVGLDFELNSSSKSKNLPPPPPPPPSVTASSSVEEDIDQAEAAAEEMYTSSLFQTEPLYQFYDVGDTASSQLEEENTYECLYSSSEAEETPTKVVEPKDEKSSSSVLSSLDEFENRKKSVVPERSKKTSRSSAMELVHSGGSACGGRRTMWAELPEVIESGILNTLTRDQIKLQEAMFEVISSEASYLKSLNILISHFVQSPKLSGAFGCSSSSSSSTLSSSSSSSSTSSSSSSAAAAAENETSAEHHHHNNNENETGVISKRDSRILFSDVLSVRQCSEKFLEDLEKRWQESVFLSGVSEVVEKHAKNNFNIYVRYCSNQVYQDRIIKKLRFENPKFVEVLRELESSPRCQSLAMQSFLMLPMQRITRLPLLIGAIFSRLNPASPEYTPCKRALDLLNKLVKECNESARSMERMEEMLLISQQLDFKEVRAIPLISASRWLVKKGEVVRIWWKENAEAKLTFGRSKINRQHLYLFLFTDVLVITKKKSEENHQVIDYCPRNLVQLSELESFDSIPGGKSLSPSESQNLAWFTLLQNNDNKTVEWLVSFSSDLERVRWIEAVTPVTGSKENPEEKIYEAWDCPRVEMKEDYSARSTDELDMQKGDTADVLRKNNDSGWYFVERRSDGRQGWIPISTTRELDSNHIRARNFKQRYAFLKLISTQSPE